MHKISLYTLLFFFFAVINNKVVIGQEESCPIEEMTKTLKYYKKTWYAMGGKFFPVIKKLLTSKLSIVEDLPRYREEFYAHHKSLPIKRQRAIEIYDKDFEFNTQYDIATIFHQENIKKRLSSLKNMDELLDLIDDILDSETGEMDYNYYQTN